jgi:mono/diheme cytochrome c family protein
MTEETTTGGHAYGRQLWYWLLGGLAGGGVVLGLMIAAYAIGYNRGQDQARPVAKAPAPAATTAPATTTAPAATTPPTTTAAAAEPLPVTPALVASGKALFTSDGCSACHSLSGSAGAGPALDGLAGGQTTLADGTTVTADDAYLERSIVDPDAEIVKGYSAGIMSAAIAGHDLASKPDDVRALVAFLESQK